MQNTPSYPYKKPIYSDYYRQAKIYNDGSHYIAIPHTTNSTIRRKKPPEELVEVVEQTEELDSPNEENDESSSDTENEIKEETEMNDESKTTEESNENKRFATRSELFDKLYEESLDLPKYKRKSYITKGMKPYFDCKMDVVSYVEKKYMDKLRSIIARKTRFIRKAYMNDFNYFVTFTYDDKKHTEETFRNKLLSCISTFQKRKGWKYMGVWERAPKTKRLHFHGLFWIPEGSMPGELIEKKDYNLNSHSMQIIKQNTYFNERFGRSDFEKISKELVIIGNAMAYILKYIEKTGNKIVYSHGLPMYVVTDVMNDDVICRMGLEDQKLLLFDDFKAWDDGCLIGEMSPKTKAQLPTSN